jgi:hypothetical protein
MALTGYGGLLAYSEPHRERFMAHRQAVELAPRPAPSIYVG